MFQNSCSGIPIPRNLIFSILPIAWSKSRFPSSVKHCNFTPDFSNYPIPFPLEVPKIGIPLCFRNNNSFVRRENWERVCFYCDLNACGTTHAFGHCVIFFGRSPFSANKITASEGARTMEKVPRGEIIFEINITDMKWSNSYLNCGCRWKWRMIIAVNFPI